MKTSWPRSPFRWSAPSSSPLSIAVGALHPPLSVFKRVKDLCQDLITDARAHFWPDFCPVHEGLSSVLCTGRHFIAEPSTPYLDNFAHNGCGNRNPWSRGFFGGKLVLFPQFYPQLSPGFNGVSPTLSTPSSTGLFGRLGVGSLVCDSALKAGVAPSTEPVARGARAVVSGADSACPFVPSTRVSVGAGRTAVGPRTQ